MLTHALAAKCLGSARRLLVAGAVLALAVVTTGAMAASQGPIKIGVMLPYSGTYAALGENITNGLKMAIAENDNKLGGREVKYVIIDAEADPSKAISNMQKLIAGANVDVVVGPVHSGVGMAMVKVARETDTLLLIPNAGFGAATGALCAPNIFRTSFTAWQTAYPMGKVAAERGYDKVVTMAWHYAFGIDSVKAFTAGFEKAGGEVIEQLWVPYPQVQFQAQLTEIASLKPDAVFVFFAGGGAVKFVKDYAAAGLKDSIPLLGSGFLTDGTLEAQGESAEGVVTTLHYAKTLDNPANKTFMAEYKKRFDDEPDVYAVQGYDTGQVLVQAFDKVNGNTEDQQALIKAIESVNINSPRGDWSFSDAHQASQNIYLREVRDGKNVVIDIAAKNLQDPAKGCQM